MKHCAGSFAKTVFADILSLPLNRPLQSVLA
jgi:hypothetical protein